MMDVRLPDGRRRRLLAAGALLSLATLLAFRVLWLEPQRESLAMRRVELERSRDAIVRARRTANRLSGLDAELERLGRRAATLRRALPERRDASAVLRGLQGIAGRSDLTVEAFTLDPVRVGEHFEEWPVRLEMSGRFHELAKFLDELSRLPWVVTVGQMSIRALPPGARAATIAVTCTVTTYVVRESAGEGELRMSEGG